MVRHILQSFMPYLDIWRLIAGISCGWTVFSLFPVIMLGLERLVKEGKGLLYGISLGVCILSNYYISIMICMFMVIYFFALWILERKERTGILWSAD